MTENNACTKDMEAAGIAWVTEQTKTPLIGIKVVTDIADGGKKV